MLPLLPNREQLAEPLSGLAGVSLPTGVSTVRPLGHFVEEYLDLDENEPLPEVITDDIYYLVTSEEEEADYADEVPRHTNHNPQLSFTPPRPCFRNAGTALSSTSGVSESSMLKNHPLGAAKGQIRFPANRKQVQPFSTMYPETP